MDSKDWWGAGQDWLIRKANEHFSQWVNTKDGQRWLKASRKPNCSPYQYGYSQPEWMEDARDALGKNDEERFKRIKLDNL